MNVCLPSARVNRRAADLLGVDPVTLVNAMSFRRIKVGCGLLSEMVLVTSVHTPFADGWVLRAQTCESR